MNEELEKIETNNTCELISRPKDKNIIRTKWVCKNKLNEEDQGVRNKERLVWKE